MAQINTSKQDTNTNTNSNSNMSESASNLGNKISNKVDHLKAKVSEVANFSSSDSNTGTPVEGNITKMLERQTSRISSVNYLNLALGSMALSAGLAILARRKDMANFVGLWAPSFLLIGIYNKLVKIEGSDMTERRAA